MRLPMLAALCTLAAVLAGCGDGGHAHAAAAAPHPDVPRPAPARAGTLRLPARVHGTTIQVATVDGFRDRFWAGVNLGSTTPGHQPGELSATRADYDRWLPLMGRLGVRLIRVYTILPPAFYAALRAYDLAHPDRPLMVLHGIWIPEERFLRTRNLYDPRVLAEQRAEIDDAVAVVHGDADIPARPGHAAGRYRADISPWLMGWSFGVEWDPAATSASDLANRGRAAYRGRFVTARPGATPTESWIAMQLDHIAALEHARGWSRPLTFTNWITADPLHHPDEPLAREDEVSVDAMHLRATPAWPGGFFASYHAYPYYPDFMRYERDLQRPGADGRPDPYAAYLRRLRAHHRGQALMITEFGVPSSWGSAHGGPRGRGQGDHSERAAMAIDAQLLHVIERAGLSGGLVFEWIDEWFKFTWNTIDDETPAARRALWSNPLTNEEHFGVLAAEPGARPAVVLDGRDGEWAHNGSQVLFESRGRIREIRALKDPAYLYLRVRADSATIARGPMQISVATRPGDVLVVDLAGGRATARRSAWADPFLYRYGLQHAYVPVDRRALRPGSHALVAPRLILNRPYVVPTTRRRNPVEVQDLSHLPVGPAVPGDARSDSRNLVAFGTGVIELRLPWALLGFSDPSSLRTFAPRAGDPSATTTVPGVVITARSGTQTTPSLPYRWDPWQTVTWHDRLKDGWQVLRDALAGARLQAATR